MFINDDITATRIMSAKTAHESFKISLTIKDKVESSKWYTGEAKESMYQTCILKFSQNLPLKQFLLNTNNTKMVEASPSNKRWGVGLSLKNPAIFDPQHWDGTNWMGEVLDRVKAALK